MKLARNHKDLKEDVEALRFVNKQTGYNLDVGNITRRRYIFEKFLLDERLTSETLSIGSTIALVGLPAIAGFVSVGLTLQGWIPPGIGGLVGGSAGLAAGYLLNSCTIGRWEEAYSTVQKARRYKETYDSEGIDGLIRRDMCFDEF